MFESRLDLIYLKYFINTMWYLQAADGPGIF